VATSSTSGQRCGWRARRLGKGGSRDERFLGVLEQLRQQSGRDDAAEWRHRRRRRGGQSPLGRGTRGTVRGLVRWCLLRGVRRSRECFFFCGTLQGLRGACACVKSLAIGTRLMASLWSVGSDAQNVRYDSRTASHGWKPRGAESNGFPLRGPWNQCAQRGDIEPVQVFQERSGKVPTRFRTGSEGVLNPPVDRIPQARDQAPSVRECAVTSGTRGRARGERRREGTVMAGCSASTGPPRAVGGHRRIPGWRRIGYAPRSGGPEPLTTRSRYA